MSKYFYRPDYNPQKVLRFIDKFKTFALRGNAVGMAVGVIFGSALKNVVASLVKDILMPPLGLVLGGIHFENYKITLKQAVFSETGQLIQQAVTLNVGLFVQVIVNFLIIAFALFIVVEMVARAYHAFDQDFKEIESQEKILKEIRDLLKENRTHERPQENKSIAYKSIPKLTLRRFFKGSRRYEQ